MLLHYLMFALARSIGARTIEPPVLYNTSKEAISRLMDIVALDEWELL
jgi:hypothetical protein